MDDIPAPLTATTSLRALQHPDLEPLFWPAQRQGHSSAWWGHVPFAHWLVAAARPHIVVELGTHTGVSYAAFCQAVVRCGLPTRCFAIDTWQGDAHAGGYANTVYAELRAYNEAHFAGFSTLLRGTFDQALAQFEDGSVDLLHIDGLHTYDAVRRDFETWRPKLSERGVVLFHDTAVRQGDFGVWRFWREVAARYPHFEFDHSSGLGVLAFGRSAPAAVLQLCAASASDAAVLRERMAALGERWAASSSAEVQRARAAYEAVTNSVYWRLTAPLRALAAQLPDPVRERLRAALGLPTGGPGPKDRTGSS